MMKKQALLVPLLAALLLVPAFSAQAHKINIFAWPEGSTLLGEVKFNGGRLAKNVTIEVQNATDNAVLATTVCDEKGEFRVALPDQVVKARPDLLLVANAGEGHRGEWLLKAAEYAPAGDAVAAPAAKSEPAQAQTEPAAPTSQAAQQAAAPSSSSSAAVNEELLRRVVAEEVSKGLSPVRKALAESQNQEPTLRDILGGIGWIVGLAGIAAWGQSRRSKK